jgi:hypothetical protein
MKNVLSMLAFSTIALTLACHAQAAENDADPKLKAYHAQLDQGIDAITKAGAESQKGTDSQIKQIQAYWGDFQEYKGTPVEDNGKYIYTTYGNTIKYK